jgi:hypothetical protein
MQDASSEEELAGMQVIVRVRPPTEIELQAGLAVEVFYDELQSFLILLLSS